MPIRTKTTTKTVTKTANKNATPPRASATRQRGSNIAATRDSGFEEGDVVLDADDPQRFGTVCRVVNAGRSYQVRFAKSKQCVLTAHSAITPAPTSTPSPVCTPDC